MADGVRIGSVVMFVRDLARSVEFYTDVLALEVADRSPTAALLGSAGGSQLILRGMSTKGAHALGAVGVQYVIWASPSEDGLNRAERALKHRSAHRETRLLKGCAAVEGRDPDDIPVVITYPGPDQVPLHELPARIYGW
jgi:catechol 2,3-dioxygenase-like lactoylglutathione lyase family enzyme